MQNQIQPTVRDTVQFGGRAWRVLDMQDDKALLIAEGIHSIRKFHARKDYRDRTPITWETCSLRRYLNEDFFSSFDAPERDRIITRRHVTADNPWLGTDGGNDTIDRIFILSLDEVIKYFGDSGTLENRDTSPRSINEMGISDQYNEARMLRGVGTAPWWLRTPGMSGGKHGIPDCVTVVCGDGILNINGVPHDAGGTHARPAMWVDRVY